MVRACLAVALFLAVGHPLFAFNPDEHRELSNDALRLCSRILASRAGKILPGSPEAERLRQAQEALTILLEDPKSCHHPDYGELVLAVDHYTISPESFRGADLFEDRKSAQMGLQRRKLHSSWLAVGLRRLGAVHTNEIHFQNGAVEGAKYFHSEATKCAAKAVDKAGLEQAFILNALADHLMQDFLAGGHVATPRANFHDLAAAVIHDSYNKSGVPFRVNTGTTGWNQLRELAGAIESSAGLEDGLDGISEELKDFVREADQQGPDYRFHGDGGLTCAPGQRAYMLLVTARSALDIIESFLSREPTDKVESGSWYWMPAFADERVDQPQGLIGKMQDPVATTSSGEYDLKEIGQIYESPNGFKIRSLMAAYSTTDLLRQGALDVDFIVSSSLPPGAVLHRKADGTTENAFKNPNWKFLAPGMSYAFSPGLSAVDVHLSVFGPLFGQDNPLSVRLGFGAYRHEGELDKRLNGGISIGKGFGLLYGEIKLDRSYVARTGGRLHGLWAPSVGVRVLFPTTWASGLFHRKCA